MTQKRNWNGQVRSVQPRIRLLRSFDERSHHYLGFVLTLDGDIDGETRVFSVAVGKAAHKKFLFQVGMELSGLAVPVADARKETAELYKASKLRVVGLPLGRAEAPPWHGVAPELEEYRQRGHRRLANEVYNRTCESCIWGCKMPTEIVVDKWDSSKVKWRYETHCYGPKSCAFYKAGPTRKIPGRKGMKWEEKDWVDEEATAHRDD